MGGIRGNQRRKEKGVNKRKKKSWGRRGCDENRTRVG